MLEKLPVAPAPPRPVQAPAVEKRSGPRILVWLLIAGVLGWGAYYFYSSFKTGQKTNVQAPNSTGSGGMPGRGGRVMPPPPVVAVRAVKGNIGVYYTGLGTVTPIYTVTIKSRVDGQLMHVYYQEGQMVRQGDPLVDIDPRPYQAQLAQYEGQLMRDQATLDNARIDLARYQQLITKKAVPEQTLATQRATVSQDEGTVKTDLGQIESVKLNISYCHILAPITGRLGLRLVDPGNYVQSASSTGLAVITQVEPISIIFTLPEDQLTAVLPRVHAGQRLQVGAYNREMTALLSTGYLMTLDNQIDQTTGTLKLRAVVDNRAGLLVANQFVNAKLLVQQKRNVTLLPSAAIQRNSQRTYAYVVKPDGGVTLVNLQLGTIDGGRTEVTSGVVPGDVVVMSGVDNLREGMKVKAQISDEITSS